MAVAFQPLPALSNVNLVRLWLDFFNDRFSRAEEKPPYDPPIERFGKPRPGGLSLEASSGPPPSRLWLVSPEGHDLVQIQRNWFARNWRKLGEGDEYPRYEWTIRPAFEREFTVFVEGLREKRVGELAPTQCEVTYINHIQRDDFWNHHGEADRVFREVGPSGFGVDRDSVAMRSSHTLYDGAAEAVGRLHAQIDSAFNQNTNEPVFSYNLTARGRPLGDDSVDGVMRFMDFGRETIVRAFAATTTDAAHEVWRRSDSNSQ